MPMKTSGSGTDLAEIDRFEGGVGWIAHPEETMERASHALVGAGDIDDAETDLWLIDPVDAAGLDDLLADAGTVAGVAVLLDRHTRDAAKIARRHDVSVHVPVWMHDVAESIDAPVERFRDQLGDTGYRLHEVSTPLWTEAALYHENRETLVVAEALGTATYDRTDEERLGIHPALRLFPPRRAFEAFSPTRVLVGHGAGVHEDATVALADALDGSRRRAPALYLKTLRTFLSG